MHDQRHSAAAAAAASRAFRRGRSALPLRYCLATTRLADECQEDMRAERARVNTRIAVGRRPGQRRSITGHDLRILPALLQARCHADATAAALDTTTAPTPMRYSPSRRRCEISAMIWSPGQFTMPRAAHHDGGAVSARADWLTLRRYATPLMTPLASQHHPRRYSASCRYYARATAIWRDDGRRAARYSRDVDAARRHAIREYHDFSTRLCSPRSHI